MMRQGIIWIILILSLGGNLVAADFSRCAQRLALSTEKVDDSYGLALDSKRLIHFSKVRPKSHKILKADPFVGLYILEAKSPKVPLELRPLTGEIAGSLLGVGNEKGLKQGTVTRRMTGVLSYARFSQEVPKNAIISSICYQIYGLGIGGNEFIEASYLQAFVDQKKPLYGDLKIRLEVQSSALVVAIVDPFAKENLFRVGDTISTLNGKSIKSKQAWDEATYALKPGEFASVGILRGGKPLSLKAKVYERRVGMRLPDGFMEYLGVSFSPSWQFQGFKGPHAKEFEQLRVGDRIMQINGVAMPSGEREGLKLMSRFASSEMRWVVDRDGFQFFLTLNAAPKQQNEIF